MTLIKKATAYIIVSLFLFCGTVSKSEKKEDEFFLTTFVLSKIEEHQTRDRKFQNVACPMEPSCSSFVKEEFENENFILATLLSLNRLLWIENRLMQNDKFHRTIYVKRRGKLIEDKTVDQFPREYFSFKREFKAD
ncbi:hypothetical protein JWG45_01425 [Leptospira sp. 201903070]|uniref:Membrane protein insertion efficiency factor YidD n=1 Tax=Leptospira ainlahdjerensis TaxID=2810033 RepID=A0ABS2U750_9LEPT|nr:hypothetical protein [Leptospira ainlahdjerensis]MBM9575803.1 hypothetical protein [Leptospira ainlahdjerensis]